MNDIQHYFRALPPPFLGENKKLENHIQQFMHEQSFLGKEKTTSRPDADHADDELANSIIHPTAAITVYSFTQIALLLTSNF